METNYYDFSLVGQVTSGGVGSGFNLGDAFTMTLRAPHPIADLDGHPEVNRYEGMAGNFSIGSLAGTTEFETSFGNFLTHDIYGVAARWPNTEEPSLAFTINFYDATGALFETAMTQHDVLQALVSNFNGFVSEFSIYDFHGGSISGGSISGVTYQAVPVPEPGTAALLVLALATLAVKRKIPSVRPRIWRG